MTPITAEWLESVGFVDGGPWYVSFDDEDDWTLNWLPETGEWFIQYHPYGGEPANCPLPNVHTRDDVRALVRMLGGELNRKRGIEVSEHLKSAHQKSVERFHELAGDPAPAVPTEPELEVRILRAKLILEEAFETIQHGLGIDMFYGGLYQPVDVDAIEFRANRPFDMIETIDGCCDLRYVTTGTLSACGVPDRPFQHAVDKNNLDKFGPGHSLREDGKLIKPPGHQPPDIQGILDHLTADWRGAIGCSPAPEGTPPPEERIRKSRGDEPESEGER